MDLTAWALYLLAAGAVLGASWAHYRFREPEGPGRGLLAGLRGLVGATILLLLWNPSVRVPNGAERTELWVLDGSLSLTMPVEGSGAGTAWDGALAALSDVGAQRTLLAVDGALLPLTDSVRPSGTGSDVAGALRSALETGADRVVLVTDGAVSDPLAVERLGAEASRLGVRVLQGERRFNAGITELEAPGWGRVGEPLTLRAAIRAVGSGAGGGRPDTVEVVLERAGRAVARGRVLLPAGGGAVPAELTFTPAAGADEPVRLDLRLVTGGGAVPDDDVRSVYVRIAEDPAGAVLLSLAPDQEPRFLLPVMERALGVPVRGWLGLPGGRWLSLGAGREAGRVATAEQVQAAVAEADLVVFHGVGAAAPGWVDRVLGSVERLLVLPAAEAQGVPAGAASPDTVAPGAPVSGDWYLTASVPTSPVAPLLAGLDPEGLPPLSSLRRMTAPAGWWAPATARLARRGDPEPVLLAGSPDGRRVAIALGSGYWRWAFAGVEGRGLYDRFWSAVLGWLGEEAASGRDAVEPVDRMVARGAAPQWRVPASWDSARVALEPVGSDRDTVVAAVAGAVEGRVRLPALPPGHYRYTVASVDGDTATGAGEITVESYSAEFTDPVRLASMRSEAGEAERPARERPLRSLPWGWLVLVTLLSVEWVLRRRWGLR